MAASMRTELDRMNEVDRVKRVTEKLLTGFCVGERVWRGHQTGRIKQIEFNPECILVDFGYSNGNLSLCSRGELKLCAESMQGHDNR